jgi:hypothetical protein
MHTVWVRLNAVVFFGLSVLLGLSMLAMLSKYGHSTYHRPGMCHDVRVLRRPGWLCDGISSPSLDFSFLLLFVGYM